MPTKCENSNRLFMSLYQPVHVVDYDQYCFIIIYIYIYICMFYYNCSVHILTCDFKQQF